MSENLTRLAQKIDFSKPITEESEADASGDDKLEDIAADSAAASANQVWEAIGTKIRYIVYAFINQAGAREKSKMSLFCRNASTEISVLIDVLNVTREKHYMVLDPVPQDQAETKPIAQVYSRKKVVDYSMIILHDYSPVVKFVIFQSLSQAAFVLTSAAERLRTTLSETSRTRSMADFHIDLLRLRQNFRLKKVSNSIIGDLSYRTGKYILTIMRNRGSSDRHIFLFRSRI